MRRKILHALQDYRYLLNRDYDRDSALRFVGDKYQLPKPQRQMLYRCVHSAKEANAHKRKLLPLKKISGRKIAVDGYNTLITLESILKNKPIIRCDDGLIRDISEVHEKYKMTPITKEAVTILTETLLKNKAKRVKFFFDAQISKSGLLASLTRKTMKDEDLEGDAVAVKAADWEALNYSRIVASSDAAIINKARYVLDLAGEVTRKSIPSRVLKVGEVFKE
ncbi:MAG: DUF434 domain-containing protein [Candidatus Bathyarchaeota archaeon]